MPTLYVWNRRTLVGGDDLQLSAVGGILFRALQLLLLVAPLSYQLYLDAQQSGGILTYLSTDLVDSDDCFNSHFFPLLTLLYLSATVVFLVGSMLLEYRIYWWANQGTITETQPRSRHLENLLEIKLVLFTLLEALICLTAVVAVMVSPIYVRCQETTTVDNNTNANTNASDTQHNRVGTHTWWVGFGLLLVTQLGEILVSLAFLTRLLCKPSTPIANHDHDHHHRHHHHHHDHHELAEELWADRCHWLCSCLGFSTCFLFGGRDLVMGDGNSGSSNYYEHVARALADYLETRGVLDVVPTDLVTGLLVVQRLQRQRMLQARVQVVQNSVVQRQQSQSQSQSAPLAQVVQRPTMTTISTTPSNSSTSNTTLRSRTSFVNDDLIKTTTTTTTTTSSLTSTSVSPGTALLATEHDATAVDTLEETNDRHAFGTDP
jgi:hypothetical protein